MKQKLKENVKTEELIIYSECLREKIQVIKNYHIVKKINESV